MVRYDYFGGENNEQNFGPPAPRSKNDKDSAREKGSNIFFARREGEAFQNILNYLEQTDSLTE